MSTAMVLKVLRNGQNRFHNAVFYVVAVKTLSTSSVAKGSKSSMTSQLGPAS